MGGAAHFKGLPMPNPTTSYWQVPPSDIAQHRTTADLPRTADYLIIGSGITGAGAALRILERVGADRSSSDSHAGVLMLEARGAASGASGRNGGHCRAGWWHRFAPIQAKFGLEEAIKVSRFEEATVEAVASFVHENKVDCDFQDVETADVILADADWKVAKKLWESRHAHEEAGGLAPVRALDGAAAAEYLKIPPAKGAMIWPAHTQNPYKLVTAMIKIFLTKGLNLQTQTPVLSLEPIEHDASETRQMETDSQFLWAVETERGIVRAKKVILATNAYSNALYPSLADQKFLTPTRGQVVAMRPGDAIAGSPALEKSAGISENPVADYVLSRAHGLKGEGDVIYGGGRHVSLSKEQDTVDDTTIHPAIADYLRDAPPRYYGKDQWGKPGQVLMEWTGIMGYTKDGFPLVGEAPGRKGLWLAVGFQGHGMALSFKATQGLVNMMLGDDGGKWPDWMPRVFKIDRAWDSNYSPEEPSE